MFYYLQGIDGDGKAQRLCNDTDLDRLGRAAAEYDIPDRGFAYLEIVCRDTGAIASTWHPRSMKADEDVPNPHSQGAPTVRDIQDTLQLARSDLHGAVGQILKLKQMTLEELPDEIADIARLVQHALDNLDWMRFQIENNNGITYDDS